MDFYTNVARTRDKILVTGYQGNKKQKLQVSYRLTFRYSKKVKHKSLDGRYLEVVELNSMGGARKFREKYDGVEGFEIHGYDRYVYTYISDRFKGDVDWDFDKVRIATLDIECECENGFGRMLASEKVNAISIR